MILLLCQFTSIIYISFQSGETARRKETSQREQVLQSEAIKWLVWRGAGYLHHSVLTALQKRTQDKRTLSRKDIKYFALRLGVSANSLVKSD